MGAATVSEKEKEQEMSFIRQLLKDPDTEPVPEGMYDLEILKVKNRVSKADNPMTIVMLAVVGVDTAPIPYFMLHPTDDLPADQQRFRCLNIKRFLVHFEVPHEGRGFYTEDLIGATARCLVIQQKGTDGTIYYRLGLPRLKQPTHKI